MDMLAADIPPKFGMLLSGSWSSKLKGTLQMDMSYATIPLFGGHKILYREKRLAYVVSIQQKPNNHPIYVVDTDLGSSIFFNVSHVDPEIPIVVEVKEDKEFAKIHEAFERKQNEEGPWKMYFDCYTSKEGAGVGIWIISPNREFKVYSFKLNFECKNNLAEYEALLLGLNALKDLGAKSLYMCLEIGS